MRDALKTIDRFSNKSLLSYFQKGNPSVLRMERIALGEVIRVPSVPLAGPGNDLVCPPLETAGLVSRLISRVSLLMNVNFGSIRSTTPIRGSLSERNQPGSPLTSILVQSQHFSQSLHEDSNCPLDRISHLRNTGASGPLLSSRYICMANKATFICSTSSSFRGNIHSCLTEV